MTPLSRDLMNFTGSETMVKRTWEQVDKKGRKTTWEWEETPELAAFIAKQTGKPMLNEKPVKKDET